jgi:hypothetical protein
MARSIVGGSIQTTLKTVQPPLTIALWMNVSTDPGAFTPYLTGSNNGTITFDINSGVASRFVRTNQTVLCTASTFENSGWTHVIFTHSGTVQQVYINGAISGAGGTDSGAISNSTSGYFFQSNGAATCQQADVAFWSVVLSATEALGLARGIRPNLIRPASLIGWWPLDGLQSPEPDLSGAANNGTLTSTSLAFGPPFAPFTPRWQQLPSPFPAGPPPPTFVLMPQIVW